MSTDNRVDSKSALLLTDTSNEVLSRVDERCNGELLKRLREATKLCCPDAADTITQQYEYSIILCPAEFIMQLKIQARSIKFQPKLKLCEQMVLNARPLYKYS